MYFDVHCHLTHPLFSKDLENVVNVNVIIHCAGSGLKDNKKVLEISKKFKNVKASFGLYPWDVVKMSKEEFEENIKFIKENKNNIVCIGEIGLDYYQGDDEKDLRIQRERFKEILLLAESLKKPVLVHTRKAEKDAYEILKEHNVRAIIHSYTGPQKLVKKYLELGFYFSIPGVVVRSPSFQSLVKKVPIERLLTETDAPYLPIVSGQRSEPKDVIKIVQKISEIKECDAKDELLKNYKSLFNV